MDPRRFFIIPTITAVSGFTTDASPDPIPVPSWVRSRSERYPPPSVMKRSPNREQCRSRANAARHV